MGHEDDGRASIYNFPHPIHAPFPEQIIADAQHFITEQDLGIDMRRDGESKPGVHSRGIPLYGSIQKF